MKLLRFKETNTTNSIFLALSILMGFVFTVSISALYVSDVIKNNNACGCVVPIPYMILVLSSLGLFVGFLAFYLLSKKHMNERNTPLATLKFLESDERNIIKALIKEPESILQSKLEKLTGMHKVKIHRTLSKLIEKDIIVKEQVGKINKIKLKEDIKELF